MFATQFSQLRSLYVAVPRQFLRPVELPRCRIVENKEAVCGGAAMKRLEEYAEQAKECREAAAKARTPSERQHLLHMAERWETLARQRAAQLHLEDVLAKIMASESDSRSA